MKPEPQAVEAERLVLGALLLSSFEGAPRDSLLSALEPSHFAYPSHGQMFQAMRELRDEGKPADPQHVIDKLGLSDGGRVHELVQTVPAVGNAPHYANLVRAAWEKRTLSQALAKSLKHASNGATAQESLREAELALLDVRSQIERGKSAVVPTSEAADAFREKTLNPPDTKSGIATPFTFLRRLQPGRLYVLGGYQADGKTACAVQFLKAAAQEGTRVGYVSVEMSWRDLTDRIVASYGVPYRDAMNGRVSLENKELMDRALEEMSAWKCDLIDDEGVGISSLRRYQKLGRYEFLIIDHLHRFDWQDRRDLERAVRTITNISREFEIPVLLLAQLHRRGDDFPRPTMSSIRESGMIEAEAAMVAFVWRKRDENKLPTEEAEFVVAKNRYGPPSAFPLHFMAKEVRFTEVTR